MDACRARRLLLDAVAPLRCAGCDSVSDDAICPSCATVMGAMPLPPVRRLRLWQRVRGIRVRRARPGRAAPGKVRRRSPGADRAGRADGQPGCAGRGSSRPTLWWRSRSVRAGAGSAGTTSRRSSPPSSPRIGDVPVMDDLGRIRDTPPQSARDEATRRGNVAGAFAWTGCGSGRRVRLARRRRAHHGRNRRGCGEQFWGGAGASVDRRCGGGRGAVNGEGCQNEEELCPSFESRSTRSSVTPSSARSSATRASWTSSTNSSRRCPR